MKLIGFVCLLLFLSCMSTVDNNFSSTVKKHSTTIIKHKIIVNGNMKKNDDYVLIDTIIPDTSINNYVFLRNSNLPKHFQISTDKLIIDSTFSYPYAQFLSEDEYLKMFFYYGDIQGEYSYFEVGYIDGVLLKTSEVVKDSFFQTESGVKLGVLYSEFIEMNKSIKFSEKRNKENHLICSYSLSNSNNYVNRNNMPSYSSNYFFRNDSLVKFSFGFDSP